MMPHYKISKKSLETLREYLECHEDEIASNIGDFGNLKNVFLEIIGRPAKEIYQSWTG